MFNSMFAEPSSQQLLSGEGRGIVFDSKQVTCYRRDEKIYPFHASKKATMKRPNKIEYVSTCTRLDEANS